MSTTVRRLSPQTYELGEGVIWDDFRRRLLWVDIQGGGVFAASLPESDYGLVETEALYSTSETVGCVVLGMNEEILIAEGDHFAVLAENEPLRRGDRIIPGARHRRLNDGACDPDGRILVGTLALGDSTGEEALLRLEPDGMITIILGGISLSNGIGFSPDGRIIYHADTLTSTIRRARYPDGKWEVAFIVDGYPDGLCVDVEGHLWVAIWGSGQVRCYTDRGILLNSVDVPAPHITSAAFVGDGRDRLAITSARYGLSKEQLAQFPESGALFIAEVGTTGVEPYRWHGGPIHGTDIQRPR